MRLTMNLLTIIEQAIPQVFGSDERGLLQQFIDRCTDDVVEVEIDLNQVLLSEPTLEEIELEEIESE